MTDSICGPGFRFDFRLDPDSDSTWGEVESFTEGLCAPPPISMLEEALGVSDLVADFVITLQVS